MCGRIPLKLKLLQFKGLRSLYKAADALRPKAQCETHVGKQLMLSSAKPLPHLALDKHALGCPANGRDHATTLP